MWGQGEHGCFTSPSEEAKISSRNSGRCTCPSYSTDVANSDPGSSTPTESDSSTHGSNIPTGSYPDTGSTGCLSSTRCRAPHGVLPPSVAPKIKEKHIHTRRGHALAPTTNDIQ